MSRMRGAAAASLTASLTVILAATTTPVLATETTPVGLTPGEVQACIEPLASRSPDVVQGWVDGCRTTKTLAYFGNDGLRNYV